MLLYIHRGAGHWIGSAVVVIAPTEQKARCKIREILDRQGLHSEAVLDELIVRNPMAEQEILCIDGDY